MPKDREMHSLISFPCIQALLQLFNVVFWFAGLSILWMGVWLRTDFDDVLNISAAYSDLPPLVLVTAGAVIIVVTSLACSCIVRVQPSLLLIYGGLLIAMLFSLVCVSIFVYGYKDELIGGLDGGLEDAINGYEANATLIDSLQTNLHCCGNDSYLDWPLQRVPASCCVSAGCDAKGAAPNFYDVGCFFVLRQLIDSNLTAFGVIITATALFPLFGAISSFALAASVPANYKLHYERIA